MHRLLSRCLVACLALAAQQVHAAETSLLVEPWPLAAGDDAAAQPDLSATPDGALLLSWIERTPQAEHSHRLRVARFAAAAWSAPRDIAHGSDFFVNWADIPHVLAQRDGTWWAHWLRRNGTGTYDYGIALVRSNDSGVTWSAPQRVEPVGAALDYGFVSLWEQASGELGIAWLDARQKPPADAAAGHDHHGGHGGGAMMLRAATFDEGETRTGEWPLDVSTCDCCPTAVATTADGPVLAYRGRSGDEIRDIRVVRFDGHARSAPRSVHDDGWRVPGCPVNGPAIAAVGDAVAVAWYTEAPGVPTLRIAVEKSTGAGFSPPIDIAAGADVVGRVALDADATSLWFAWLASDGDGQALWLSRRASDTLQELARVRVAQLAGRGAATGLPKLRLRDEVAHLVWTDVVDGGPRLRGARVRAATPGG